MFCGDTDFKIRIVIFSQTCLKTAVGARHVADLRHFHRPTHLAVGARHVADLRHLRRPIRLAVGSHHVADRHRVQDGDDQVQDSDAAGGEIHSTTRAPTNAKPDTRMTPMALLHEATAKLPAKRRRQEVPLIQSFAFSLLLFSSLLSRNKNG